MKKNMTKFLMIVAVFTLILSISVTAHAQNELTRGDVWPHWSSTTVTVPGTNRSGFSNLSTYKGSTDSTATFKCTSKSEDRNFDARLVNCYNESRSKWARNLDIGEVIHVQEKGALKGYLYSCEISSDLFTVGDVEVSLDFSPDYMT